MTLASFYRTTVTLCADAFIPPTSAPGLEFNCRFIVGGVAAPWACICIWFFSLAQGLSLPVRSQWEFILAEGGGRFIKTSAVDGAAPAQGGYEFGQGVEDYCGAVEDQRSTGTLGLKNDAAAL